MKLKKQITNLILIAATLICVPDAKNCKVLKSIYSINSKTEQTK